MDNLKKLTLFGATSLLLMACGEIEPRTDEGEVGTEEDIEVVETQEEVEHTREETLEKHAKDVYGKKLIEVEYIEDTGHYRVIAETAKLSPKMDRQSAYIDTTKMLEKIKEDDIESIYIELRAIFRDVYGNEEQGKGIAYWFDKETIDKINFDNMIAKNLPDVADSYWQHPAFNVE